MESREAAGERLEARSAAAAAAQRGPASSGRAAAAESDDTYPRDTGSSSDVREMLRAFARPRMSGSDGAREVRSGVKRRFEKLGYEVTEHRFDFSAVPGRFGLPLAAGALAFCSVIAAVVLATGFAVAALILLGVGAAAATLVAVAAIPMLTAFPWGVVEGRNLLAQRPGERPRYVIMAHLDSKAQLVPLSLRAPAVAALVIGWLLLLALGLAALVQPLGTPLIVLTAIVMLAAGVLLALSLADNRSPGALDNASGLAALVAIAARERDRGDVAYLATDGEELGLAGARAIAAKLPPVFGVLNLDGLDDDGTFYLMERFGLRRRGTAPHLAAALLGAAAEHNIPIERRDLPYGLMVDHIPIVNAGQPAATLMRGSLKSMSRVHRPSDTIENLRGTGIEQTVELVCAALARLREQEPSPPATAQRSAPS